ncbi:MAG TPA: endo-1,4-beta-xylanase [Pirellulales bacterium]
MRQLSFVALFGVTLWGMATTAWSQTSLTGSSLAYKAVGSSNTLSQTGTVGTYLVVPTGGATISFDVNATGTASPGHMNVVVANSQFGFNVNSTSATAYDTPNVTLPAGTYFVNVQRDYNNNTNQTFTVNSLSVNTVSGSTATFANDSWLSNFNAASADAMNAANTYISNYRKGSLNVSVLGAATGSQIEIKEVNSAFKWGTAVPDTLSSYLKLNSNSNPTSLQTNYSTLLRKDFNSVTPENAGKWQGSDGIGALAVDTLLAFAAQSPNGMRVRQHNLIWGSQQPSDITADFTTGRARSTVAATATSWMNTINTRITAHINNYVGGNDSITGVARAKEYDEMDVYNESYNTGANANVATGQNYWKVMSGLAAYDGTGTAGTGNGAKFAADVYNRVQTAVTNAGATTKLFTNDYNVVDNNSDNYGQTYSQHVESVRKVGGAVSGIGTEYYNSPGVGSGSSQVNPARAYATWQNLSAQGLPLETTEFGETVGAASDEATSLTTAMTLAFGTPQMKGFTLWGFYGYSGLYAGAAGSVLYDSNFNITAAGTAYEALHDSYTTDVHATVNADGTITLPANLPDKAFYYGDYAAIINGKSYTFTYDGSNNSYALTLTPVLGDFNLDGHLTAADIAAAESALADLTTFRSTNRLTDDTYFDSIADVNGDGEVNNADLQSMIGRLIAGLGGSSSVPEPSSLALLGLGGFALGSLKRRRRQRGAN